MDDDITLRLDRATAEDQYAILYQIGEHVAAGARSSSPTRPGLPAPPTSCVSSSAEYEEPIGSSAREAHRAKIERAAKAAATAKHVP